MAAIARVIFEAVEDFAGYEEECGSANDEVVPAQLSTQAPYCDSNDSRSCGNET